MEFLRVKPPFIGKSWIYFMQFIFFSHFKTKSKKKVKKIISISLFLFLASQNCSLAMVLSCQDISKFFYISVLCKRNIRPCREARVQALLCRWDSLIKNLGHQLKWLSYKRGFELQLDLLFLFYNTAKQ